MTVLQTVKICSERRFIIAVENVEPLYLVATCECSPDYFTVDVMVQNYTC